MSGFLQFLRCLFCCQDEEYEDDVIFRGLFRNGERDTVPSFNFSYGTRTSSFSSTTSQYPAQNARPPHRSSNLSESEPLLRQTNQQQSVLISSTSSPNLPRQTGSYSPRSPRINIHHQDSISSGSNSSSLPAQPRQESNLDSSKSNRASTVSHVRTTATGSGASIPNEPIKGQTTSQQSKSQVVAAARSTSEKPSASSSSFQGAQSKSITNLPTNKTTDQNLSHAASTVAFSRSNLSSSSVDKRDITTKTDKHTKVARKSNISPSSLSKVTQKPNLIPSSSSPGHACIVRIRQETKDQNVTPVSSGPHSFSSNPSDGGDPPSSKLLMSYITQQSLSRTKPPPSSPISSSSSSSEESSATPKALLSTKRKLALAESNFIKDQSKNKYVSVEKGASLTYAIPENIRDLLEKNKVPEVLKKPLSPSTYKDYFASLLHAEDFYFLKWDGFEMKNVTLELHKAEIYKRRGQSRNKNLHDEEHEKVFVAFEIDSIPERRPYLLSKDFVDLWPARMECTTEPFRGILYRVVKRNLVLADFDEDFHRQHVPCSNYTVRFSFNRVCLKRAHEAIAATSHELLKNFLFPKSCISTRSHANFPQYCFGNKLSKNQTSAVKHILSLCGAPPYILEGPLSLRRTGRHEETILTETGVVIQEAVAQIYQTNPSCKILMCAPSNKACDALARGLRGIPDSDIFRANAAFREWDEVPLDILANCVYKEECFVCPQLQELRRYRVISSTYMSSFRLKNEGLKAGHFSHIFLVDCSSVIEPESIVPLSSLANEKTVVVVTGMPRDRSHWVRSSIARENGSTISYFERLRDDMLYDSLDPKYITQIEEDRQSDFTTRWYAQ